MLVLVVAEVGFLAEDFCGYFFEVYAVGDGEVVRVVGGGHRVFGV